MKDLIFCFKIFSMQFLVFLTILDTMQSYLATMKLRHENQKDVNTFWIKVHQSGEIPWMSKISSTWEKVEAHSEEMSTVFIALQGEKVDAKVRKTNQSIRQLMNIGF